MSNTAPSNVVHAFPPAPSLHEGLLDGVRTLINEGDLLPGVRVPERELCARFKVSRTPLRECTTACMPISCGGSCRATSR